MSQTFTDHERQMIANMGYDAYSKPTWHPGRYINPPFSAKETWLVDRATVHEGESGTGLDAVVLKDPASKTMRVIYRGVTGGCGLGQGLDEERLADDGEDRHS